MGSWFTEPPILFKSLLLLITNIGMHVIYPHYWKIHNNLQLIQHNSKFLDPWIYLQVAPGFFREANDVLIFLLLAQKPTLEIP